MGKRYERRGEYFGELALLTDEPRKATIRATGVGATVAVISRNDFEKLLGPLKDTLKKYAAEYPQYAEILGLRLPSPEESGQGGNTVGHKTDQIDRYPRAKEIGEKEGEKQASNQM